MICAGIVTYNPDLNRLKENINSISKQVKLLIIFDNGSKNIEELQKLCCLYKNIALILSPKNKGIAYALNRIVERAYSENYLWLLTLDQDSVCFENIITDYEKCICTINNASIICSLIKDRNFKYYDEIINTQYTNVKFTITSGACINIKDCFKIGGFDEQLFIDWVDSDYCFRIDKLGKKIVRINKEKILHEVGIDTRNYNFLWKKITIFNHNAFRVYYICRNGIYLARKNKNTTILRAKITAINRLIIILLFEKNKLKKIKAGIKGVKDSKKMQLKHFNYLNEQRRKNE